MQETLVWFLGWEDPLGRVEKKMATHSSVLSWREGEPGGLPSMMGSHSQTWLMRLSRSSSQRRDRLTPPVFWGFPDCSDDKESARNVGDLGSIPGLGRSPGEGNGYLLQNSCLENSTDWGTWQATVHGVTKGQTQLSDFNFQEIDYWRRPNNELYLTIFQGIFQGRERNLPLKLWWKWGAIFLQWKTWFVYIVMWVFAFYLLN